MRFLQIRLPLRVRCWWSPSARGMRLGRRLVDSLAKGIAYGMANPQPWPPTLSPEALAFAEGSSRWIRGETLNPLDPCAPAEADPLLTTIAFTWADVYHSYGPEDPELWLHPADWERLDEPSEWAGIPVRTSAGVVAGSARFFDRATLRYLPETRTPPAASQE